MVRRALKALARALERCVSSSVVLETACSVTGLALVASKSLDGLDVTGPPLSKVMLMLLEDPPAPDGDPPTVRGPNVMMVRLRTTSPSSPTDSLSLISTTSVMPGCGVDEDSEAEEDPSSMTKSKSSRSGRGGGLLAGREGGVPDRLLFQSVAGGAKVGMTGAGNIALCCSSGFCWNFGGGGRGGGVLFLPLRMGSVPFVVGTGSAVEGAAATTSCCCNS